MTQALLGSEFNIQDKMVRWEWGKGEVMPCEIVLTTKQVAILLMSVGEF